LDLNLLAMLCLRMVESGVANSDEREEAERLRGEWALLIGNAKPVIPEPHTEQGIEMYAEGLRQRMLTYLARFPHCESFQQQPVSRSKGKIGGAAADCTK